MTTIAFMDLEDLPFHYEHPYCSHDQHEGHIFVHTNSCPVLQSFMVMNLNIHADDLISVNTIVVLLLVDYYPCCFSSKVSAFLNLIH